MIEIINGFAKLPEAELYARGADITLAMTGNLNFPGPVPQLDAAKTALTEYEAARTAASGGDRLAIAIKNQKKDLLVEKLHNLSAYVLLKANNDAAIVLSAKFNVRKTAQPLPPLQKPAFFKVENGVNSGELRLITKPQPGVRIYLFQYTTDPEGVEANWIDVTATTCKVLLSNLTSGSTVRCRVVLLGTNQQKVYGDIIAKVVQ